ncbi:MAG: GTPase ObgE, partial [Rhodospirillales bacterium]
AYGGGLGEKRELVILNKSDAMTQEAREEKQQLLTAAAEKDVAVISGVSGQGLDELMSDLLAVIREEKFVPEEPKAYQP